MSTDASISSPEEWPGTSVSPWDREDFVVTEMPFQCSVREVFRDSETRQEFRSLATVESPGDFGY